MSLNQVDGIIRIAKRKNPYAQIDRRVLQDKNLSFKAKGILAYLLGHTDDWQPRVTDIMNQSTDGRDAVLSGMNELRKYGYATFTIPRSGDGKIRGGHWTVYETPQPAFPAPANQAPEKPVLTYTDRKRKIEKKHNSADAEIGFFLTPKSKSKIRQLCERYDSFVLERRWRARDDARPILGNWVLAAEELIGRLEGDFSRFEEVVSWYMENHKNPYIKNHSAITTLCKNFFGIEKAMCRDTKQDVPEIPKVKKPFVAIKSCEIEEIPE